MVATSGFRVCIVGTSRCGTTLMRQLLHEHPDLALFDETHWLPTMFEHVGLQRVDWRVLFEIAAKTTWDTGEDLFVVNSAHSPFPDGPALAAAFRRELGARGSVTLREFHEIFAAVCFEEPRSWGDKTPDYGFHMGLLQRIWPDARFLHVVRDALDTARSMSRHPGCQLMVSAGIDNWCSLSYDRLYDRYERRPLPLEDFVASWGRRLRRIRDEARRLEEGTYLEIRYEDLQDDGAGSLRTVADWLSLEATGDWLARCAARIRPRRPDSLVGSSDADRLAAFLIRLTPTALLDVKTQDRRPELSVGTGADAETLRRALDRGRRALDRGDAATAALVGLDVLATRSAATASGLAGEAVELLHPWSALRGHEDAVERWALWAAQREPELPIGGSGTGAVPDSRGGRRSASGVPRPRLAMMMCVHDEARTLPDHLLFHRAVGVDRVYVYVDRCSDGTAALLEILPWVVRIDAPRPEDGRYLTPYQNDCARHALELARSEGVEWLLHLDPDEYAWAENRGTGDVRRDADLKALVERAAPSTELIRMDTREAVPVRDAGSFPLWRQEFFQVRPRVLERDVLDPTTGRIRELRKWIGHVLGKSLVRTNADAEPESSHAWRRRIGGEALTTEWLGFHYHFVVGDAENWRSKYAKHAWQAPDWETGAPVPFPKQAWKEASVGLDETAAREYYERWVAIPRDRADALVRDGVLHRDRRLWSAMEALRAGDGALRVDDR